ncbi:MAG: hypothetical protein ACYDDF_05950 [Thermoplasmatota archaeon]
MADALDYDGLSNRLRKERSNAPDRLTRAEPNLFSDAEAYIRRLAEESQRESQLNPASAKATLLLDELRNARRALEDLYDAREHKILMLAAVTARGASIERAGMTKAEQEVFDQLVRLLRDARRQMLRHGERGGAEEQPPTVAPAPRSEPGWPQEAPAIAAPPAQPAAPAPPIEAMAEAPLPVIAASLPDASLPVAALPARTAAGAPTLPTAPVPHASPDDIGRRSGVGSAPPAFAPGTGAGTGTGMPHAEGGGRVVSAVPDRSVLPAGPVGSYPPAVAARVVQDAGAKGPASPPAPSGARSGRVLVRVLAPVPPFTASDMRTYRLAPEDIVALPKEAAKALVLRGQASYVVGA